MQNRNRPWCRLISKSLQIHLFKKCVLCHGIYFWQYSLNCSDHHISSHKKFISKIEINSIEKYKIKIRKVLHKQPRQNINMVQMANWHGIPNLTGTNMTSHRLFSSIILFER